jgi:hypothetical protein
MFIWLDLSSVWENVNMARIALCVLVGAVCGYIVVFRVCSHAKEIDLTRKAAWNSVHSNAKGPFGVGN